MPTEHSETVGRLLSALLLRKREVASTGLGYGRIVLETILGHAVHSMRHWQRLQLCSEQRLVVLVEYQLAHTEEPHGGSEYQGLH